MMAAYNDVNGVAATEQEHVNNEIVKGEWGYDGLIMSDWFATKTAAPAANGGLDLVMPGPDGPWGDALVAAVRRRGRRVGHRRPRGPAAPARRPGRRARRRCADWPADLPAPDSADPAGAADPAGRRGDDGADQRRACCRWPARQQRRADRPARDRDRRHGRRLGPGEPAVPGRASPTALTAQLGDAVTVTDGVEVRDRPLPAAATSSSPTRRPASPASGSTLFDADGAAAGHPHSADAPRRWSASTTSCPAPSARVGCRGRSGAARRGRGRR